MVIDGAACSSGGDCTGGVCADDVCCDTACEGVCEACDVGGSEGLCTAHAGGTDPEAECRDFTRCSGASSCAAEHLWSHSFGSNASTDVHEGFGDLAVDAEGNVVIVGELRGSVDFGGGAITAASSKTNVFVAKLDAAGQHVWSERFGDISSIDDDDIFVAKLSPSGACAWSRPFGGSGVDRVNAIAVEPSSGRIVIVGEFSGTLTFDVTHTSAGGTDVFVAGLGPTGQPQWSVRSGDSASPQMARDVALDGNGNALVIGSFVGSCDFDTVPLTSAGADDIFVAKYDSVGALGWAKQFGDTKLDQGLAIAAVGGDEILVAGRFLEGLSFGTTALTSSGPAAANAFVARLTSGGAAVWSRSYGITLSQDGQAIASDDMGNVLFAGSSGGDVDFGGGLHSRTDELTDAFVVKLDDGGGFVWSLDIVTNNFAIADDMSVAMSPGGEPVIGGVHLGKVDFGGDPLPAGDATNVFVAKLTP